jgi:hypothetical protein
MDLKTQINPNILGVGDFNTSLSPIGRSSKQKINKEILELKDTIGLMDQTDSTEYSILK